MVRYKLTVATYWEWRLARVGECNKSLLKNPQGACTYLLHSHIYLKVVPDAVVCPGIGSKLYTTTVLNDGPAGHVEVEYTVHSCMNSQLKERERERERSSGIWNYLIVS